MGSWDRDANKDRDVLEHIVALLFALADLTDLAAGLPALHRCRMLAILGCGEAVARAFVIGMATNTPFRKDEFSRENTPAPADCGDALLLAARFRALARIVAVLLARAALSKAPRARVPHAGGSEPARQARRHAASPAPDTSRQHDPPLRGESPVRRRRIERSGGPFKGLERPRP